MAHQHRAVQLTVTHIKNLQSTYRDVVVQREAWRWCDCEAVENPAWAMPGTASCFLYPPGHGPSLVTRPKEKPLQSVTTGVLNKNLAVSYFHMGKPHTIIGAKQFHFRVRDGSGGSHSLLPPGKLCAKKAVPLPHVRKVVMAGMLPEPVNHQLLWCYMVKPHGQLVLVSFIHC